MRAEDEQRSYLAYVCSIYAIRSGEKGNEVIKLTSFDGNS